MKLKTLLRCSVSRLAFVWYDNWQEQQAQKVDDGYIVDIEYVS